MTESILKELFAELKASLPKVRVFACPPDELNLRPRTNPDTGVPMVGPSKAFDGSGRAIGETTEH